MSSHYIFNEAGCIPGIAGTFANCRVDIDDDGTIHQSPLAVPIVDVPTNVASESEPEPEPAPVEAPAPEAQSEPTSPPSFFNGG